MRLTPKHQKIADDINKAFEKVAHCNHSFEVVMRDGFSFQRCVKCYAMRKMKEGNENV